MRHLPLRPLTQQQQSQVVNQYNLEQQRGGVPLQSMVSHCSPTVPPPEMCLLIRRLVTQFDKCLPVHLVLLSFFTSVLAM